MPLHKIHIYPTKSFPTKLIPKPNWRTQLRNSQLISQISSTLLQRHNWGPLLPLSSLTPPLLLSILHRTQSHPQISLSFFNWAKKTLSFQLDLKTQCFMIRILIGSGLTRESKPILESLIQEYPPARIADSAIGACKGTNFQSPVLGSVLECYCRKGSFLHALEVYKKGVSEGFVLSVRSCNALLDALLVENETTRLAWGFYGNMLRNNILPDRFTWSLITRILCKDGKFETIVRILDMGICSSLIYDLVIDCYSKRGDFRAAFDCLNEMRRRNVDPEFSTYSSILDGACRYGDNEVIEMTIGFLVDNLKLPLSDYDLIIRKLSEMKRAYAMSMFFERACNEEVELKSASYGYLLIAFSEGRRVKEAIRIYREIVARYINVNDRCFIEFVNALCDEDPSEEISGLLKDIIVRGLPLPVSKVSDFVTRLCAKHGWGDADELLNAMLDKDIVPSSLCCSSLVLRYCKCRRIDLAIALYNKMEKVDGVLDVETFNLLVDGLVKEKRVEEANKVFGYMRTKQLMNGESFSIMICGLAQDTELKKAMKLHDEMIKLGLKPDKNTYKRLILCFK